MTRTRLIAFLMAGASAIYAAFAIARAWTLFTSGHALAMGMGVAIVAIPVLGVWLIWRELSFGLDMQQMGRLIGRAGRLPVDDLPKTASGRVQRDAADARFLQVQHGVEQEPQDWMNWYLLAIAYDDARDRKRARASMRHARLLWRQHRGVPWPRR